MNRGRNQPFAPLKLKNYGAHDGRSLDFLHGFANVEGWDN